LEPGIFFPSLLAIIAIPIAHDPLLRDFVKVRVTSEECPVYIWVQAMNVVSQQTDDVDNVLPSKLNNEWRYPFVAAIENLFQVFLANKSVVVPRE
jgi:hypothetical protein